MVDVARGGESYEKVGLVEDRRLPNGYRDFPPETVAWLQYIRTAQALGFSLSVIARTGEELREAPDTSVALSALFEKKIQVIDTRIAELAPLRASGRPARETRAAGSARTGVRQDARQTNTRERGLR
ncbi:MerR family DNA-binding protein [Streptomyces sp. NPDC042207]|uniref:MerR family DNA-binding protein n=1 Tax=Streptomyces sp. NPDC042207 TaxID=3154331 RepID=UPI0033E68BF8